MRLNRRLITLVLIVVAAAAFWLAASRQSPHAASVTVTPTPISRADFVVDQCVRVTRPTLLRFGPGIDYPVFTNIPARPQPPITIIDMPVMGFICSSVAACQPYGEGWWWPVEVVWPDSGDVDRGWLWQGELRACN